MKNENTTNDVLEVTRQILIRCTVLGIASLLIWWGALELFGDLAYDVHSKVAPMTRSQFEIIHYTGMLVTKSAVAVLFFFPYIAITLVVKKREKLA